MTRREREQHAERAPLTRYALHSHPPTMRLHQPFDDRQSHSRAVRPPRPFRHAVEGSENPLLLATGNADALVAYRDLQFLVAGGIGDPAGRHGNGGVGRRILCRVFQEIGQHLFDLHRVQQGLGEIWGNVPDQRMRGQSRLKTPRYSFDQFVYVFPGQ